MTQPAVPGPGVSWPDIVTDALVAPAGARWHRVALQVNPYGYQGMSAPSAPRNRRLVQHQLAEAVGAVQKRGER